MGDDRSTEIIPTYDQSIDERHRHIPVDEILGVVIIELATSVDECAVGRTVASAWIFDVWSEQISIGNWSLLGDVSSWRVGESICETVVFGSAIVICLLVVVDTTVVEPTVAICLVVDTAVVESAVVICLAVGATVAGSVVVICLVAAAAVVESAVVICLVVGATVVESPIDICLVVGATVIESVVVICLVVGTNVVKSSIVICLVVGATVVESAVVICVVVGATFNVVSDVNVVARNTASQWSDIVNEMKKYAYAAQLSLSVLLRWLRTFQLNRKWVFFQRNVHRMITGRWLLWGGQWSLRSRAHCSRPLTYSHVD